MATTQKGIYYPDDYTAVADVPEDMKKQAESVDTAIGNIEDTIEQDIQTQIDNIEEEQTTQNNEITALQTENTRLKATLPTTTGEGENITLSKTAELEFIQPPLPRGNSKQDGEPTPTTPIAISNVTGDVEVLVQNKNLFDYPNNKITLTATRDDFTTYLNNYEFTLKANKTYVISMQTDGTWGSTAGTDTVEAFLQNVNTGVHIRILSPNGFNITPSVDTTFKFRLDVNKNGTTHSFWDIQVEQGTTATTYTPHKEQTFTFPLGSERLMLGDYLADDGIHHVRRKISLPVSGMNGGSEDYPGWANVPYLSQDYPDKNQYFNEITHYMTNIKTRNAGVGINTRNQSKIILNKFEFNLTETQWKTQYPNLVFEIEYELAEEEITPYTTEQQQAYDEIKQAISYEEQTNISGSSDESNPLFSVEAVKPIPTYVEDMIDENITSAIGGAY